MSIKMLSPKTRIFVFASFPSDSINFRWFTVHRCDEFLSDCLNVAMNAQCLMFPFLLLNFYSRCAIVSRAVTQLRHYRILFSSTDIILDSSAPFSRVRTSPSEIMVIFARDCVKVFRSVLFSSFVSVCLFSACPLIDRLISRKQVC